MCGKFNLCLRFRCKIFAIIDRQSERGKFIIDNSTFSLPIFHSRPQSSLRGRRSASLSDNVELQ